MPKVKGPSVETRLTANTTDFNTKMKVAYGGVKRLDGAVLGLTTAFGGLAVAQFAKSIFDAGVRAERTGKSYEAITGNVRDAGVEMAFVRKEADRLGMVFYDTADSYKKLFAAARGTNMEGENTRKIFIAMSEAGTALGLSNEDLNGSLYAISQMMSKGKVQAEELRGQLGERLPGAFNMAAEALGVTTGELNYMLERGEVLASDLLPRLADVMHERFVKGAESMAKSQVAAVNRMQTAWEDFKTSLSSSDTATAGVNAVTSSLEGLTEGVDGWKRMFETTAAMFNGELGFTEWLTMSHDEAEHWLETVTEVEKLENRIADLRLRQRGQIYRDEKEATEQQIQLLEKQLAAEKDAQRLRAMKAIKGDTLGHGDMAWTKPNAAPAPEVDPAAEKRRLAAEERAAKQIKRINAQLTDTIKRNTMERFEYERWALEQRVEAMREKNADEITLEECKQSELKRIREEEIEALKDQTKETEKEVDKWEDKFGEFGDTAEGAFNSMGSSMKDIFGTGNSLLDSFIDKAFQLAVMRPFENWLTTGGGFGGGSGGLLGLGFLGFADGGVSTSPGLAMVSEGRYRNEAHVPLPDGRTIPVTLDGAAQGSAYFDIDITIPASSGDREQDAEYARTAGQELEKSLDAYWNKKMRMSQRPGGAMNKGLTV
ncbi:tape measure protein [Pseudodesulfovibrio sp. JC047]|uniref:tape measure protein n=1 Tax=Pseudodesulfovibrio sp. JC047 TaxID=2683199 RepID=UPI0013D4F9B3|nr:tape measure protein [Pseudodesulfovibrio sp. JC047]NDV20823.1 tape measure protein [Pseudodesulfovibrio sp. JC047]